MSHQATLEGLDVSSVQFMVDYSRVARTCAFAIIKAGEGASPARNLPNRVDGMALRHTSGFKNAGMRIGYYWFGKPISDPIDQARFFASKFKWMPGDLPPALDLEVFDDLSPAHVTAWAVAFLTECDSLFDVDCTLYTYQAFAQQLAPHMSDWWKTRTFWEAKYAATPSVVSPLPPPLLHQYAGNDGRVDGVLDAKGRDAPCDRDRFFGDEGALAAMCCDANDPY